MGENYLIEQARNARKRRDSAMRELEQTGFLTRPDLIETSYPARPLGDERFESSEILFAFAPESGLCIDLLRGNRRVGIVEGEGARSLHEALRGPGMPTMVAVRLSEVSPLSGAAEARIIKEY